MEFWFPRKIGRLSYLLRNIILTALSWPIYDDLEQLASQHLELADWGLITLAILAPIYFLLFIVLPRCRDRGLGWGTALLLFVPFVNIGISLLLLFGRSMPEEDVNAPIHWK